MLSQLDIKIKRCAKCELSKTCRAPIPWSGNIYSPKIVFIAEAPGETEDLFGQNLIGKAGQLLRNYLTSSEHDYCFLNIVKCRPPNNRTPTDDEIAACYEYIIQQLKFIVEHNPNVKICLLGKSAVMSLATKSLDNGFSFLVGNKVKLNDPNFTAIVNFHPSYIARQGNKGSHAELFQRIIKELHE